MRKKLLTFIASLILLFIILPLRLYSQIHISGEISGVLTDTIYVVDSTISISWHDTLMISPGCSLYFTSEAYFLINEAVLIAHGTSLDSILFTAVDITLGWPGIIFTNTTYDLFQSQFSFCIFLYSNNTSISSLYSLAPEISHSRFSFNNNIRYNSSSCICYNNSRNIFLYNNVFKSNIAIPIKMISVVDDTSIIKYCHFHNNNSVLYAIDSNLLIDSCIISGNYCDSTGSIISLQYCYYTIMNSILNNNVSGNTYGCINTNFSSNGNIVNSTFYNNQASNRVGGVFAYSVNIINSIFFNNSHMQFYTSAYNSNVFYSCFYANDISNLNDGIFGYQDYVNSNGDSCDYYNNIFTNPLLSLDNNNFLTPLQESPCIDAGDPSYPTDPDGSVVDIGAISYSYNNISKYDNENIINNIALSLYPNPTNNNISISTNVVNTIGECRLYNINGQLIEIYNGGYSNMMSIDVSKLSSGYYILSYKVNGVLYNSKLVITK